MPFDRPPLDELRLRIWQDLTNKLKGANTALRVNNLRVFGEVEAGSAHLLYGRLYWNFLQLFPDTADPEYLEQWASIWGVRRSPSTRAAGPCVADAEPGSFVNKGDLLQVEGGTLQYRIKNGNGAGEFGGQIRFDVDAVDYGLDANLAPGVVLRFLNVRPGVAPLATTLPNGIVGGANEDTDEELLAALLNRIQSPPHGGNKNDYEQWMYQISGVTRAWCYPLERGLGTVALRFMMDDVRAVGGVGDIQGNQGIPTNGDCEAVWNYIDPLRPVTADLGPDDSLEMLDPAGRLIPWGWGYVFPPWPKAQAVRIATLTPDSLEIRAAITAELQDMIRHDTAPGKTLALANYYLAIGNSPGVRQYRLIEPTADVTCEEGEIITLGPISFEP
jgi:uncharacterized phage protein gp47/JayE